MSEKVRSKCFAKRNLKLKYVAISAARGGLFTDLKNRELTT